MFYVCHGEEAEAQGTEPLDNETPGRAVSSSPSPRAQNVVATQSAETLGSQNGKPSNIPGKDISSENLSSCHSAASPPPTATKVYLWFMFGGFEAHCTCDLETPTSNPPNFKCYNVFPFDISIYLEDPESKNEVVVDDNGNPFLIGHIRWPSEDTELRNSIKAYGQQVITRRSRS